MQIKQIEKRAVLNPEHLCNQAKRVDDPLNVPIIGKSRRIFSRHWKKQAEKFQPLETREFRLRTGDFLQDRAEERKRRNPFEKLHFMFCNGKQHKPCAEKERGLKKRSDETATYPWFDE